MQESNPLLSLPYVIDIPGLFKSTLTFSHSFIEYKKTKIYYTEIINISFRFRSEWINGVAIGDDYLFFIESKTQKIRIDFKAKAFNIGNKQKSELASLIVKLSIKFIFPSIITKYISQLFDERRPITISNLSIGKTKFAKLKFFKKPEAIPFEQIFRMNYEDGRVNIYINKNDKIKRYCSLNMLDDNAVIIPFLIPAIRKRIN
jgi:hypothetical protein